MRIMDCSSFCGFLAAIPIILGVAWPCASRADDLPLAAGEVVRVDIYGRADLSGERMIDAAGMVLVPLLGRVAAAAASPEALEAMISVALTEAGLIEGAEVFVEVVRRRDVFVDGDVMVPGAYAWRPGLTAGQAVTLAGGLRRVAADELGTTLQAYSAVERFAALHLSVAALQGQEARLLAQGAFVTWVFDAASPVDADAAARLNVMAFLPADVAGLPLAARDAAAVAALGGLDIVGFRALQLARVTDDLIIFPPDMTADPQTQALRGVQADVIENQLALWLANLNSLQLQRRALTEKARILDDRRKVIDALVVTMQDRLNTLLELRDDGLVRAVDVVDMQSAFSTLITTQLELLGDIADTQIATQQQDLAIGSFAATLRRDIGQERAVVVAALTEAAARLPEAKRAAAVAAAYRAPDAAQDGTRRVQFQITPADPALPEATASTLILPGQSVTAVIPGTF